MVTECNYIAPNCVPYICCAYIRKESGVSVFRKLSLQLHKIQHSNLYWKLKLFHSKSNPLDVTYAEILGKIC